MNLFNLISNNTYCLQTHTCGNWSTIKPIYLVKLHLHLSVLGMENWIIGIQNRSPPLNNHQLPGRAPECPNQSRPSSHQIDPLLLNIFNCIVNGVYCSTTLCKESISKHCDNSTLTVTCCQQLFKVNCNNVVMDEAGRCVNIYCNMCVLLDSLVIYFLKIPNLLYFMLLCITTGNILWILISWIVIKTCIRHLISGFFVFFFFFNCESEFIGTLLYYQCSL